MMQMMFQSHEVIQPKVTKPRSRNFSNMMKKGREAEEFKNSILALEAKFKPKKVLLGIDLLNIDDAKAGRRAWDRNAVTKDASIRTVHCRNASGYTEAEVQRESAKRGVKLVQEKIAEGNSVKYGLVSYTRITNESQLKNMISIGEIYAFVPPEVTGKEAEQLGRKIDMMVAQDFCGSDKKMVPFAFAKFNFERMYPERPMD